MKKLKKVLSAVLCMCMLTGAFILPSVVKPSQVEAFTAPKPITLSFFTDQVGLPKAGVMNDPVSKHIAQVTGVTINAIIGDINKFKVLVAGANLPDIINIPGDQQALALGQNMIKSKEILPLDSLLAKYGKDISKAMPQSIKYSKFYMGPTAGKMGPLYFLPTNINVSQPDNPSMNGFVGLFTRFDLYQKIGSPTIKNDTDYLNALKKMVDLQPKAQNGAKTYAFSGWTDWGLWPYTIGYPAAHGYINSGLSGSVNLVTKEYQNNFLDRNSIFWQGIKFYYKANQLGIFDQQAFTQKYAQYDQELQNGSLLVSDYFWTMPDPNVNGAKSGLFIIPGTNPFISQVFPEDQINGYGIPGSLCISSKCKYPDRAIQLLNYANTTEGSRWIANGPKGTSWDVINGKPQLIGQMLQNVQSGGAKYPELTKPGNLIGFDYYQRLIMRSLAAKNSDGYPISLSQSIDFKIASATPAQKNFAKVYGKTGDVFPGQAYANMLKTGLAKNVPTYPLEANLAPLPANYTKLAQISAQADTYIQDNLPKFILAKDDADFTAQQAAAIKAVKAMGLDQVNTAEIQSYKDGAASVAKFKAAK